jgi:hypothetical protein
MSLNTQINFGNVVSGSAAKPSAVNGTFFYARWSGYLVPSATGVYTIGVNAGDGANLFIGDTPIVQQLAATLTPNSTLGYNASGTISLTKGVSYPITVEWQHGGATNYELQLIWTPPGGSAQLVPAVNLSTSTASVTGNITGSWWNGTSGLWYPSGPGVIDFANPNHVNKDQDHVGDGATFKRLSHVSSGNTLDASTALNKQGSIIPNQSVLLNVNVSAAAPNCLTVTWPAQSLLRADSSSLNVLTSDPVGSTLLTNGQGETGTIGSQVPGWTLVSGSGLLSANDFAIDTKSMKVTNGSGGGNSISDQSVTLVGGQVYVLVGFIKTDALAGGAAHGSIIRLDISSGIGSFSILTKFGAYDAGLTTIPAIALPADGTARGFTFVQCYFIPASNGVVTCSLQHITTGAGSAWFDNVFVYPFGGRFYSLTAGATYHLYPYVDVNAGTISFTNGAPPGTSPSDTLAMQTQLDGRAGLPPISVTMPSSGGTFTGTGGGSGTCPEENEPVFVRRYSETGALTFEGTIRAGEIEHGHFDGEVMRGDFIKGFSFTQKRDVFRGVQRRIKIPCHGWSIVSGRRVTCCEMVFVNGLWTPAWKAPGAVFDAKPGYKVMIEVQADADDEHNYYCGDLLIHNGYVLGC